MLGCTHMQKHTHARTHARTRARTHAHGCAHGVGRGITCCAWRGTHAASPSSESQSIAVSDSAAGWSKYGSDGRPASVQLGLGRLQSTGERSDASVTPDAIATITIASSTRGFWSPRATESRRIHSGTELLTMV